MNTNARRESSGEALKSQQTGTEESRREQKRAEESRREQKRAEESRRADEQTRADGSRREQTGADGRADGGADGNRREQTGSRREEQTEQTGTEESRRGADGRSRREEQTGGADGRSRRSRREQTRADGSRREEQTGTEESRREEQTRGADESRREQKRADGSRRESRREEQTGGADGRSRREEQTGGADGRSRRREQTGTEESRREQKRADGSRREQTGADVTWKVRRSLLGLSLMSSIGAALIITSVITAHATHAQLHRTQHTVTLNACTSSAETLLELKDQIALRLRRTQKSFCKCRTIKQTCIEPICFLPHRRLHGNCFLSNTTYRKPYGEASSNTAPLFTTVETPKPSALLHLNTDSLHAQRAGIQKSPVQPTPINVTHSLPMQTDEVNIHLTLVSALN